MQSMKERLEAARKAKAGRVLKVGYVKFENRGDSILGRYVSKTITEGRDFAGQYFQYVFEGDEGPFKCHFGGAFDDEYAELLIPGRVYHIEYLDREDIGHNRFMKRYTVLELPEEVGE